VLCFAPIGSSDLRRSPDLTSGNPEQPPVLESLDIITRPGEQLGVAAGIELSNEMKLSPGVAFVTHTQTQRSL
jgi:hypothetical protein